MPCMPSGMSTNINDFLREFLESRGIVVGPDTDLRAETARILSEEAYAAAQQTAEVLGSVNNDAVKVLQFTGDRLSGKLGGDNPLQRLVSLIEVPRQ